MTMLCYAAPLLVNGSSCDVGGGVVSIGLPRVAQAALVVQIQFNCGGQGC